MYDVIWVKHCRTENYHDRSQWNINAIVIALMKGETIKLSYTCWYIWVPKQH